MSSTPEKPELPEAGRPHLRRALQALPAHAPDAALWPRVAARLDAEAPLRRAIARLPTHEPDPAAWTQLERSPRWCTWGSSANFQLATLPASSPAPAAGSPPTESWRYKYPDRGTALNTSLSTTSREAPAWPALPSHAPDDALWDAIAARLAAPAAAARPAGPAAVPRQLWPPTAPVRRLAALAASLLLLMTGWLLRPAPPTGSGPHETVAYSQETVAALPAPALSPAPDPLEAEGLAFIDAHCQALPSVCQSADFQSLRSQLDELEAEEKDLSHYARQHGASPELVRNQVKIIKLKATVTRELIQLLIS